MAGTGYGCGGMGGRCGLGWGGPARGGLAWGGAGMGMGMGGGYPVCGGAGCHACGAWTGLNCTNNLYANCGGSFPGGYLAEAYTPAAAFQFGIRRADTPVEVIAAIIDAGRPTPADLSAVATHSAVTAISDKLHAKSR